MTDNSKRTGAAIEAHFLSESLILVIGEKPRCFSAVRIDAIGTSRHSRRCNIPGRYWINTGH